MRVFENQNKHTRNRVAALLAACLDRFAGLGGTYLTAALLGGSYLGLTVATSLARYIVELAGSMPRRIWS